MTITIVLMCVKYDGRNEICGGNGRIGGGINAHSGENSGTMAKMREWEKQRKKEKKNNKKVIECIFW